MNTEEFAQHVVEHLASPSLALPRGLHAYQQTEPTQFEGFLYEPVICLILQGRKEATIGDRAVAAGPGECIVVSHDLPVLARITHAAVSRPYVALIATLDLSILRSLYDQVGETLSKRKARAFDVNVADAAVINVMARYFALANKPLEAPVMGPLIRRELHFRLLMAPNGAMLRSLLHRDSHASNISQAIELLRDSFKQPLAVPHLARVVGMSPSSFYKHFKSVTATTPLQYQKELRLMEARRLLRSGLHSVSEAAYEVGYGSPTQFSREYARRFSTPPRQDLREGV